MDYVIVCRVALCASVRTLFSGFGLGTLLLPAFLVFLPAELAVGMTAVIHLLNNLFKFALLGKMADRSVVLRFGIPAIAASLVGAWLLILASGIPPLSIFEACGRERRVLPVNLLMGVLIIASAILEIGTQREHSPAGGRAASLPEVS